MIQTQLDDLLMGNPATLLHILATTGPNGVSIDRFQREIVWDRTGLPRTRG